jgi:hypothetical protein
LEEVFEIDRNSSSKRYELLPLLNLLQTIQFFYPITAEGRRNREEEKDWTKRN